MSETHNNLRCKKGAETQQTLILISMIIIRKRIVVKWSVFHYVVIFLTNDANVLSKGN